MLLALFTEIYLLLPTGVFNMGQKNIPTPPPHHAHTHTHTQKWSATKDEAPKAPWEEH